MYIFTLSFYTSKEMLEYMAVSTCKRCKEGHVLQPLLLGHRADHWEQGRVEPANLADRPSLNPKPNNKVVGRTDWFYSKHRQSTSWICASTRAVSITGPRGRSLEAPERERFTALSDTAAGAIQEPHWCSFLALLAPGRLSSGLVSVSEAVMLNVAQLSPNHQ